MRQLWVRIRLIPGGFSSRLHHSIILELNLPSYRMQHAKQGQPGRNSNEATEREK